MNTNPTNNEIDQIRVEPRGFKEYHDSVRCAFQYLQAQERTTQPRHRVDKHIVETWQGLYVAIPWLLTAAQLAGLKVDRRTSEINISNKLTLPDLERLQGIKMARTHMNYTTRVNTMRLYQYFKRAEAFQMSSYGIVKRMQINNYIETGEVQQFNLLGQPIQAGDGAVA